MQDMERKGAFLKIGFDHGVVFLRVDHISHLRAVDMDEVAKAEAAAAELAKNAKEKEAAADGDADADTGADADAEEAKAAVPRPPQGWKTMVKMRDGDLFTLPGNQMERLTALIFEN